MGHDLIPAWVRAERRGLADLHADLLDDLHDHERAADSTWAAGEGPHEVRGPEGDLLVVATGRPADPAALAGPGVEWIEVAR